MSKDRPRIGFVPLGNPNLDVAKKDVELVLENLRKENLEILPIDKMTWQMPNDIPEIVGKLVGEKLNLVLILVTTAATSICVAELVNRLNTPVLVWALPTRYAAPSAAAAVGYLRETSRRIEFMVKDIGDKSAYKKVLDLAIVSYTINRLRESKIGIIGNASPFLLSSRFSEEALGKRFGVKIEKITKEKMDESLKGVQDKDAEAYAQGLSRRFKVKVEYETLKRASRFHLALKELMEKYQLDAVAVECWTNLVQTYNVNPCLGHFENFIFGCEGDVPMTFASLIIRYLSGITPFLADPYGLNYDHNILTVCHCSAPLELASSVKDVTIMSRRPVSAPSIGEITAFSNIRLRDEVVTLFRIKGLSLNRAHTTIGKIIGSREMDGSMCVDIRLKGDLEGFIQQMDGQHYCLVYEDLRDRIRDVCKWFDIDLVET